MGECISGRTALINPVGTAPGSDFGLRTGCELSTQYNKGLWFYQSIARVRANDSTFKNSFMLQQTIFNFRGRYKNAGHLQHVVRSAVIPVVALFVDVKLI